MKVTSHLLIDALKTRNSDKIDRSQKSFAMQNTQYSKQETGLTQKQAGT